MHFTETKLKGLFIIDIEAHKDERGFFARSWCEDEFKNHGLDSRLVQCNISSNKRRGTLRGMHYQVAPFPEAKLVRCTRGAIYDVIVDIRTTSPTFGHWLGIELTEDNHRATFIPVGFAHGFQTLQDNSEILYQMSEFYHPECAHGVRWNDPAFKIDWPIDRPIISQRDNGFPNFQL